MHLFTRALTSSFPHIIEVRHRIAWNLCYPNNPFRNPNATLCHIPSHSFLISLSSPPDHHLELKPANASGLCLPLPKPWKSTLSLLACPRICAVGMGCPKGFALPEKDIGIVTGIVTLRCGIDSSCGCESSGSVCSGF